MSKKQKMDSEGRSDRPNYKHLWMTEKGRADVETGKPREFWTKIGVAYENSDGSFALYLKAFPVDGRVVMQDPWPRDGERHSPGSQGSKKALPEASGLGVAA